MINKNTFLPKEHAGEVTTEIELIRSTPEEKGQQIDNVANFQRMRNGLASGPFSRGREKAGMRGNDTSNPDATTRNTGLVYPQKNARDRQNVFTALMQAVKTHSLGQIRHTLL